MRARDHLCKKLEKFIQPPSIRFFGENLPTHGSLTKAGKVRSQTPKIEGIQRKSPIPRRRNRVNYVKRVLTKQESRFRSAR
jgi:small subunit ribosomal protein S30e